MPRYAAFLKAINVGGHVVKMDALRELFEGLKFSNVETFIASGNVLFETKTAPDQKLEQKIEKHLETALGYEVGTFVRSIEEILAISVYQTFSDELAKNAVVVSVGFMRAPLNAGQIEQAMALRTEVDELHFAGREVYWLCRVRTSDSKFPAKKLEKVTGSVTWRNRNTVVRMAGKYSH